MDSAAVRNTILQIIKAYLLKTEYSTPLTDEMFAKVCLYLQRHDIAHLAAVVLYENAATQDQADTCFRLQYLATARYEKLKFAQEKIYHLLEEHHIPFIPLKGAVLADYYQESWHRTSCDLDVMIPLDCVEKTTSLLQEKLNFSYKGKSEHDLSFISPNDIFFELHYAVSEKKFSTDEFWQNSTLAPGKQYQHVLSAEFFILYHIAHMAKHFQNGGCGYRALIDLWVIQRNMPYDKELVCDLLEKKGLKTFADKMFALTEVWFGDKPFTPFFENLTKFISDGGVYGSVKNKATIAQIKKKNRFRAIFSRIFLPYNSIKETYPRLERFPWLLPFYQLCRWFRTFKPDTRSRALEELSVYRTKSTEQKNKVANLLAELDLL